MDEVQIEIKKARITGPMDTATECDANSLKTCLEQKDPPRNHIMTQMVRKLTVKGETEGSLREYVVDTRGVFGEVDIKCLGKNSCNGMTVLFQRWQDYGYEDDNSRNKQAKTAITITCAFEACLDLMLFQLADLPGIMTDFWKFEKMLKFFKILSFFVNLET